METKELELYIHIPFCVKKCKYCDFLSFPADNDIQRSYTHSLIRELEYYGPLLENRIVTTIFIGGGTPSWLDTGLLQQIMNAVYSNFYVWENAEITMECNPGTVTFDKMKAIHAMGINRLSIGLQSTEQKELECLGRIHTYDQFLKTYEMARNVGFHNINVDLMSGLPYQTAEMFAKTLHRVIRLKPEHISAYSLIIEKGTPFYEAYKFDAVKQEAGMQTEVLPTEEEVYRTCKLTQKILEEAGYYRYEISNFARPGYACRHNVGYWSRVDYLGVGLGAASLLDNVRYSNIRDIYHYIDESHNITMKELESDSGVVLGVSLHETGEALSRKEQMEEFMFLGLRKIEGVSRAEFEQLFGVPLDSIYKEVLAELKEEQLIESKAGMVTLTDQGRDVSNYAMAKFLLD